MNKWLKIKIVSNPVLVDSLSDYLVGIIGAGVEIGVEDHVFLTTINGYVENVNPGRKEIDGVVTQVRDYLIDLAGIFSVEAPQLSWEVIEDEDWGKTWKKHFSPFAIIPDLVVAPTWEKYQAGKGEHVIVMDPGMAFGTGHHATTALTLQLLGEELPDIGLGRNVLDVGTGTGILGMAAVLFGAEKVLGIDNDLDAVMAARENVLRNNLSTVMEVSDRPLGDLDDQYALVVANIIHDVLVQMANDLQRLTATGGKLILSGVLHGSQAQNIISVFRSCSFTLEKQMQREEWAVLQFIKM